LEAAIAQLLSSKGYDVNVLKEIPEFIQSVQKERQRIDCLLLDSSCQIVETFSKLASQPTLLPAVVIHTDDNLRRSTDSEPVSDTTSKPANDATSEPVNDATLEFSATASTSSYPSQHNVDTYLETNCSYHSAVMGLSVEHLQHLPAVIDRSIVQFLKLPVTDAMPPEVLQQNQQFQQAGQQALKQKQQDLSKKLKERLGYVGVYYKRDPANFLRHMEPTEKREFLTSLKLDYREIVLGYFSEDSIINQKIDTYVNKAFLADVPVAQVVEIHMDLMDEFAKQLQIEGRSEEILLDYRLTLIDLLANLCEIYRRAIPREPKNPQ
jgi:circadian clock protein KaiA